MNEEEEKELKRLLRCIYSETKPIEGHTDPMALEDCWDEVWKILGGIT